MPQSLVKNVIHLIYSVRDRQPLITDDVRDKLHAYTIGIMHNYDCLPIQVNSVTDHNHILFVLSPKHALARIVEEVKKGTSKWIKSRGATFADFYWQPGYAAYSVSEDEIAAVKQYIARQAEHHRTHTFQDELRALLKHEKIAFNEQYLWD